MNTIATFVRVAFSISLARGTLSADLKKGEGDNKRAMLKIRNDRGGTDQSQLLPAPTPEDSASANASISRYMTADSDFGDLANTNGNPNDQTLGSASQRGEGQRFLHLLPEKLIHLHSLDSYEGESSGHASPSSHGAGQNVDCPIPGTPDPEYDSGDYVEGGYSRSSSSESSLGSLYERVPFAEADDDGGSRDRKPYPQTIRDSAIYFAGAPSSERANTRGAVGSGEGDSSSDNDVLCEAPTPIVFGSGGNSTESEDSGILQRAAGTSDEMEISYGAPARSHVYIARGNSDREGGAEGYSLDEVENRAVDVPLLRRTRTVHFSNELSGNEDYDDYFLSPRTTHSVDEEGSVLGEADTVRVFHTPFSRRLRRRRHVLHNSPTHDASPAADPTDAVDGERVSADRIVFANLLHDIFGTLVEDDERRDGSDEFEIPLDRVLDPTTTRAVPYTGSIQAGAPTEVPETPAPGRPHVVISEIVDSTEVQQVNHILTNIATTREDTYVYYMGETTLLPFLVLDVERAFALDECYLVILKETYASVDQWNIYYIMGQSSDEDTRSTTAEYALMLHDRLKIFNISFVYRKFQKSAFNNILVNIRNHLLQKKESKNLYLIELKMDDNINTRKVPPNKGFFNSDVCLVLFTDNSEGKSNITQACGNNRHDYVKLRANQLVNFMRAEYSDIIPVSPHNRLKHVLMSKLFLRTCCAVNVPADFSEISAQLDNNASTIHDLNREGTAVLIKFSGPKEIEIINTIPQKFNELKSTACYMLDSRNYAGVFFWVGSAAPIGAQATGIDKLENYINKDLKIPHSQVTVMQQGYETLDFKLSFPGWYN